MPKKRAAGEGVTIDATTYTELLAVMDELAFRGPKEEALVMRIAKAAGFAEVMTAIKRRRIYAKKHAKAGAGTGQARGNAGKARRKRTAHSGEGESTGAAS